MTFLAVKTNSRNAMAAIAINRTEIILFSWAFMIGSSRYFQQKAAMMCKFRLITSKITSQKAVELFLWPRDILEVIMAKINPTITPIKEIIKSVCGPKKSLNHLPECKIHSIVRTVTRKVKLKNAFIFCLLLNNQETKAYIL